MNKNKLPLRLLRQFCRPDLLEELEGDLMEMYESQKAERGAKKAIRWLWWEVVKLFRPGIVRSLEENQKLNTMLIHNLTLTFRNFRKHRSQFLINLTGLSTGLACVLFIYLWVRDERSMDQFHEHSDRLYQVMSNHTDASGIKTWKGVPGLLLEEIQSSIPEVEKAVATTDTYAYTLSVGDSYHKAQGKFASEDFFDVFSFPLSQGKKESLLTNRSGIVITESLAMRLFGTTDVIGKQLIWHFWNNEKTVQVTGVLADLPASSSDKFDFLMSWNYYHDELITYKQWGNYYGRIFLTLNDETDPKIVDNKVTEIIREHNKNDNVKLFLARYSDRYLYDNYENGEQAGGRIEYVQLFTIIALFILFIACVNFINLTTAKAAYRIKEIGVKKSMGATRRSLVEQYFTESLLLATISMGVAYLIVWIFMPQFNTISQKEVALALDVPLLTATFALLLVVGVIAGSYPAFYLSGLNTIEVIKGKLKSGTGGGWGRNALVVVQFTLSIIMISAVVIVYNQMDYVNHKNLGYDRENLVYFVREGKILSNYAAFLQELKNVNGVVNAEVSGFMVGGGNSTGGVSWEGKAPEDQIQFWEIRAGHDNLGLLGIEMAEGRDFSPEYGVDTSGVIFNETAIAAMGMDDPIGKKIRHYEGEKTIIGVVRDFNMISLHTRMEPMMFLYDPNQAIYVMARIEKGKETQTLGEMEKLYTSFNSGFPFNPQFVDQDYQAQYVAEKRVSRLSGYFAGFAILISCLGLFGLAAFTVERRTKEIGVRKILGAGVFRIVVMLSGDFTKMVVVAIVLALPIAYLIAASWLENFAYSIELNWWYFALSAVAALIISWLTVSTQTFKAATINPASCLRDE